MSRRFLDISQRLAIALIIADQSLATVRAQFVDVDAEIEVSSWKGIDAPPMVASHSWNVHCVVGTNMWLISAGGKETGSETWWYTGSNLVWKTEGTTSEKVEAPARVFEFDGNFDSKPNGPLVAPHLRIAWLAFCSGPFLGRTEREIPALDPSWKQSSLFFDHNTPPVGFKDSTVRFEDELGLPISIDLFAKNGQPILQYRVHHAHAAVPLSTNVLGWEFPLEFQAIEYLPQRGHKGVWDAHLTARGKLISVKPGTPPKLTVGTSEDLPAGDSLPKRARRLRRDGSRSVQSSEGGR